MPATLALLAPLLATLPAQERRQLAEGWQIGVAAADGSRPELWRPVPVPEAFETVLGTDFDGVAWYRRELSLPPAWRGRAIRVEFHAAATDAVVYCNGVQVGRHLGGWTPFRVRLDPHLRWDGGDLLEVRVDERVGHDTQGFLPVIQPHFGGLWQPVWLCADTGPVLDRFALLTFGHASGRLQVHAPVLGRGDTSLRVEVLDGATTIAAATGAGPNLEVGVEGVRLWEPGDPNLYRVRITLLDGGRVRDVVERRVGFRDLRADGHRLLWNGRPLQVRGVLHWGYSPPHLAPPPDPSWWRGQLEEFRAMGCNLVKACLWLPPPSFFELCDELGLLVWQEYPTWHPQFTAERRDRLAAEFAEFHLRDRSHPSVAFRSLTCETGQGASLEVIQALYDGCHELVPDTLVVDDSSWIGWQRVTDFYDDHPYGNNSWWPGKLQEFARFLAEHPKKPLLLGECLTGDTWVPLADWDAAHAGSQPWWQPLCLQDQRRFEGWLAAEFGQATLASLLPWSRDYAMRNRKYQIERLRQSLPETGYVMSVARDFAKARMGFFDDLDRPKWTAADWVWHRDTMLCLDTPGDCRAFVDLPDLAVRLSCFGRDPLRAALRLRLLDGPRTLERAPEPLAVSPGTVSRPVRWRPELPAGTAPRRVRLQAELGDGVAVNAWDLWLLPPFAERVPPGLRVVQELSLEVLAFLEGGGRVLLQASPAPRSLRVQGLWFLRGAPFAPPHPLHERLPPELLLELQSFDLEQEFVLPWRPLLGQVDPILAFWETHDIPEVRAHLFCFDTRVGRGRLLVSAFEPSSPAGRYVRQQLLEHLASGPAPRRALTPATLAALRGALRAETLPLRTWRALPDPDGRGDRQGFARPDFDDRDWPELRAGAHWEGQGVEAFAHHDGIAWFRIRVDVPASWRDQTVHAVFEGVDDSYRLFVNGEQVAEFGDPETGETVWLQRTFADVTRWLQPGRTNTIVLRVVDHQGAGGLWKPAYLTTGPPQGGNELLNGR